VREMKRRLVILTEIMAPYRIPVFNALAERGEIDLRVIFLAENDPGLRQWLVYKDEIRFSYVVLPSWRTKVGRHKLLLNRGLKAALHRASPHSILCGGYNYVASWQVMLWARRNHVPLLLWVESTAQDLRGNQALIESLKTRFMRNCDAFVVPGKSSFEYLRNFDTPEESIFTAPNAVDIELFARLSDAVRKDGARHRQALQLPARFFLFVGRLVPEKGVFELLRSYGRLAPALRSEVGLVFVGDGAARSELSRQAAAIVPGSIRLVGFAQRDQLASYYALAEALVFPTHTDPWGLVVNEAMACGLPIISTDAAGCAADLVEDGWNGRVVRVGDTSQLVSAMQELAGDGNLRSLMSQRSRERVLRHSPEVCAAGIVRAVFSSGVLRHE
jgi:glycosyltransferase involved in cell wall biosynthesis